MYATVAASDVARDGVLWKCPVCGELMHPLPGTTGAAWAEQGCYLHRAKPPTTSAVANFQQLEISATARSINDERFVTSIRQEPEGRTDAPFQSGIAEPGQTLEHEDLAPSLSVPGRNQEHPADDAGGIVPGEQGKSDNLSYLPLASPALLEQPQRVIVRERVVVYRVPFDRQSSPVLMWASDHMPSVQLLIALMITGVLIYITSFG